MDQRGTDGATGAGERGVGDRDSDVDVLVVGGGPTGMMAACELLRRGIRVRVVDRAPDASKFPKALVLWPRTLDLLEDLDAADEVRSAGVRINTFRYFSERKQIAQFDFTPDLAAICLPQNETERILRTQLHRLGGKVEQNVRLLGLDGLDYSGRIDGSEHITAVLEHADGTIERARVPFLIGADGAGSAVRKQLGTGFVGSTYESAFAIVDTYIEGELPRDEALYYQSRKGALVVVALPGGAHRFFCSLPPGQQVSVPMMQQVVDERGPSGVKITDPIWQSVFRVHARQAESFQLGRVFLIGDAAHVHSPASGQGMNTGIQDAHNIAWKLASVIRGEAPTDLLTSYQPERKAVAERVVRDTDIQTRAWLVNSATKVAARDAAFRLLDRTGVFSRFYGPVMAGRRLAYPSVRETQEPSGFAVCRLNRRLPGRLKIGSVLPRPLAKAIGIVGTDVEPPQWTVAVVPPRGDPEWPDQVTGTASRWSNVRVVTLAPNAERELGCRRAGYYLIRPDGHIGAHGHTADLQRLDAELARVCTPAAQS
jgi:2-polyprenyl-6-methoxyphenol hydroxylase-like FAD-dependent oxidoreductase